VPVLEQIHGVYHQRNVGGVLVSTLRKLLDR
jgi:hypothetical protein